MALAKLALPEDTTQNDFTTLGDIIPRHGDKTDRISVNKLFIQLLKRDHTAAIFLDQVVFWAQITHNPEGWFYKTHAEWESELELSADQVRRSIRKINCEANRVFQNLSTNVLCKDVPVENPIIEQTRKQMSSGGVVSHYRINFRLLELWIMEVLDNGQSRLSTIPTIRSIQDSGESRLSRTSTLECGESQDSIYTESNIHKRTKDSKSDSDSTITFSAEGGDRDKEKNPDDGKVTSLSDFTDKVYLASDKVDPLVDDLDPVVVLSNIEQQIPNWNQSSKFVYVGHGRRGKKSGGIQGIKKSEIAKVVFKKKAVGTFEERMLRSEKVRQRLPDLHGKTLVVDAEDEIEPYGKLLVRLAQLAVDDQLPPAPLSRVQNIIHSIAREIAHDKRVDWDKIEGDIQLSFIKKAGGFWERELKEMDEIAAIAVEQFEQFVKDYRAGNLMEQGRRGTYFPQASGKLSYWYGVWKARQRGHNTPAPQQGRGVVVLSFEEQVDDHRHGNSPEAIAYVQHRFPESLPVKLDYSVLDDDEWGVIDNV